MKIGIPALCCRPKSASVELLQCFKKVPGERIRLHSDIRLSMSPRAWGPSMASVSPCIPQRTPSRAASLYSQKAEQEDEQHQHDEQVMGPGL